MRKEIKIQTVEYITYDKETQETETVTRAIVTNTMFIAIATIRKMFNGIVSKKIIDIKGKGCATYVYNITDEEFMMAMDKAGIEPVEVK